MMHETTDLNNPMAAPTEYCAFCIPSRYTYVSIISPVSATCLLPFIHLLAVSFSGSAAVNAGKVGLLPVDFTTSAYEFALRGGKFLRALLISVERVVLGVGLNLILMVLTAYPLSKSSKKVAGRNIYMTFFVITMLISGGMIPTYLVVTKLGLKDTARRCINGSRQVAETRIKNVIFTALKILFALVLYCFINLFPPV